MPTNNLLELRGLPVHLEAEKLTLAAMLMDAEWRAQAVGVIRTEDFSLTRHKRIFQAVKDLAEANAEVDHVTVYHRLRQTGEADADSLGYLVELNNGMPTVAHPEAYGRIVRDKAALRRLILACNHTMNRAAADEESPADVLASHQKALRDLEFQEHGDWVTPAEVMERFPGGINAFLSPPKNGQGIPTPWSKITEDLAGLQLGNLMVLAGRPSMGKSVIAMQLAYHAAQRGYGAAVISLEMSKESLVQRMISAIGSVDHHRLRTGYLNREERSRLPQTVSQIAELPLWIDDTRARTVPAVVAAIRKQAAKKPIHLLIIDHLQLMKGTSKADSRNLELGEILHDMKILAGDMKICVCVLSQLNRQCEIENRQPQLSDLKETGTSEEDADVVWFVHRPERYAKNANREDLRGYAEFIIGKQRNGVVGKRKMVFLGQYQRFEEMAGELE